MSSELPEKKNELQSWLEHCKKLKGRPDYRRSQLLPRPPIPVELYSFYEDRPFQNCTRCGEGILDMKEGYRVFKLFSAGELIMESAFCEPCLKKMDEESSKSTRARLLEFHQARIRDVSGFEECSLCEAKRKDLANQEFKLIGTCLGEHLIGSRMVCPDCLEEMNECISEETRGGWDRIKDENFPGIPSDFEPFPDRTPVETGS